MSYNGNGTESGGEWLQPLILKNLHEVLSTLGAVKASQDQMPRDLMRHLDRQAEHFDIRLSDMAMNYGLRLDRLEEIVHQRPQPVQSPPEAASLAVRLFGSVGAWAIERVPWKHVAYMVPGLFVAVAGHLFPAEAWAALKAAFAAAPR